MAIFDLYSKRQRKLRGEVPDVYQYEEINNAFRVQVVHIVRDTFGQDRSGYNQASQAFRFIHKTLCKEYGVLSLKNYSDSDFDAIYGYLLNADDHEKALDIIELSFKLINTYVRDNKYQYFTEGRTLDPDDAITELNHRFKEHGIKCQFESNELIRIDSQTLPSEVITPVLRLLSNEKRFKTAMEEYLNAHSHFCHGLYGECLTDILKAFESVMKVICQKQGWAFNRNDTAERLVEICFQNKLIPLHLKSQFTNLCALLANGVPSAKNMINGHGRGSTLSTATESTVSYVIYLASTNIVFMVGLESEKFS